jgi:hypothetical protein
MTDAAEFKQPLFWTSQQGRQICGPCNNLWHRFCEGANCECLCRELRDESESKSCKRAKHKTKTDQRRAQTEFKF